ncbi:MAG: ComEC/Rec2 family competence protein [Alphaproteobacteria bacterium]|nr:ComEC/Rec2 family competence protein [Alphaproteobacteria bacterium]
MSLEGNVSLSEVGKWGALDVAARRTCALFAAQFLAERDRWPLWLPVLAGVGILLYFASAFEPAPLPLLLGLGGLLLAAISARQHPGLLLTLALVGAVLAGYAAASLRAEWVAAPSLERQLRFAKVTGEVAEMEPLAQGGVRVVLERISIERLEPERTPSRIRLRLPAKAPPLVPGNRIRLYASLMPPGGPALPGGFDFARQAWFQRLGAIGYGMGSVELLDPLPEGTSLIDGFRRRLSALRYAMTLRIQSLLPGDTGAVASALITGGERAVSLPLLKAYRDSGLAHLLSISGLHMTLVAGLVFVGLRALLALIGPLALNYPIKKWTALGALLATLFYLLVSGAFVPTQRSFLMTGLVLLGVVLDRQAISLRLVAWPPLPFC